MKLKFLQPELAQLDDLVLTAAFQLELRGQLIIKLTQLHHSDIYVPKKIFLFLLGVRTFICLVTDQSPSCLLYKERFTNIFNEWKGFLHLQVARECGQLVQAGLRLWIACDYCRQTVAGAGIVWDLKGQCHEIFDFRFTTWISFPQAPDYTS